LGYEFTAIDKNGVIYPTPGMLLNLNSGNLTKTMLKKPQKLINDIISSGGAELTPYENLSIDDLYFLLNNIIDSE
jgi:hypothetical protein